MNLDQRELPALDETNLADSFEADLDQQELPAPAESALAHSFEAHLDQQKLPALDENSLADRFEVDLGTKDLPTPNENLQDLFVDGFERGRRAAAAAGRPRGGPPPGGSSLRFSRCRLWGALAEGEPIFIWTHVPLGRAGERSFGRVCTLVKSQDPKC